MRGEKGERTRGRILEAARSLFHLQGYSKTTMDEIVIRSGVTKGNLYYYFASKEDLAGTVVDQFLNQILTENFSGSDKRDPVRQIMEMFIRTEKKLGGMDCRGGCLFGNLAVEVSDLHDGIRKKLEEVLGQWEARVYEILESGIQRGFLKADLQPKMATHFILAVFEGGILLAKVKKDVKLFRNCRELVKSFLEANRA